MTSYLEWQTNGTWSFKKDMTHQKIPTHSERAAWSSDPF